jgi:hypothetical protein
MPCSQDLTRLVSPAHKDQGHTVLLLFSLSPRPACGVTAHPSVHLDLRLLIQLTELL